MKEYGISTRKTTNGMPIGMRKRKYNNILKEAKKTTISEKIYAHNRDTKQLYKLVSEVTPSVKENPLPMGKSNNELAEEFTDFFWSKIQLI